MANPIHFQSGSSTVLHTGDGVGYIAIGCPIIQLPGAILPSGLDAGLISVWTNGVGGADGGSSYRLDIIGGAQNVAPPYAPRLTFEADGGGMTLGFVSSANQSLGTFQSVHEGVGGCTVHHLLSFRISTGTAYYYVNDVAQPVNWVIGFGGTFGATPASTVTTHYVPGVGGAPTGGGFYSDAWFGTTAGLIDLTVTANRRKFINADLTPADLGSNGQTPFGTPPALFMSAPAGSVAPDWRTNRGSFGGTFSLFAGELSLDGDPCGDEVTPSPPAATLALDDVLVTAEAGSPPCLISLEWSDDRGHHFGNPVSQPMGGTGHYGKRLSWHRLGYTHDRVFRLSWSCPAATALLGAWIELSAEGKGTGGG